MKVHLFFWILLSFVGMNLAQSIYSAVSDTDIGQSDSLSSSHSVDSFSSDSDDQSDSIEHENDGQSDAAKVQNELNDGEGLNSESEIIAEDQTKIIGALVAVIFVMVVISVIFGIWYFTKNQRSKGQIIPVKDMDDVEVESPLI